MPQGKPIVQIMVKVPSGWELPPNPNGTHIYNVEMNQELVVRDPSGKFVTIIPMGAYLDLTR